MQRQLNVLSLNYQFVDAIDKYDLRSEKTRAKIAQQLDINKSDMESIYKNRKDEGTVASMLSHLKVYSLMIKKNIRTACILEDDGKILSTFPNILTACRKVPGDLFMLSSQSSIIAYIGRAFLERKNFKILRLLISIYKLVFYKKYWPQLNSYTLRCTVRCIVKYLFLKYLRKIKASISKANYKEDARGVTTFAVEIGALPTKDRASWHKITPKHYLANPLIDSVEGEEGPIPISITSCMAYVLTRSAAVKWKQAAIDLSRKVGYLPEFSIPGYASKNLEIDHIPRYLYCEKDVNLYVLVSPCVRAEPKYMTHSVRVS